MAQQRLRESGIPPAHERTWAAPTVAAEAGGHIEAALAECTRTEANLGSLLRGLTHLTAGATAAREANEALLQELDTIRQLLGRSNEHELSLRTRVRALEQALENAERDAALARALLIEQEDLFLAELLTDHERELEALERRLLEVQSAPPPALPQAPDGVNVPPRSDVRDLMHTLDELALDGSELPGFEREEQRESTVVPISTMPPPPEFEADAALGRISTMPPPPGFEPELSPPSQPLVVASTDPPPPRSHDSSRIAMLTLRTISIGPAAPPLTAATSPTPDATAEETTAPDAVAAEPLSAGDEAPPRHDSKPALRQKPDPSTRPLVGYSLGSEDIAEEIIDTSRLGSRPTNR